MIWFPVAAATVFVLVALLGYVVIKGGDDQDDDYEIALWEEHAQVTPPGRLLSHRRI